MLNVQVDVAICTKQWQAYSSHRHLLKFRCNRTTCDYLRLGTADHFWCSWDTFAVWMRPETLKMEDHYCCKATPVFLRPVMYTLKVACLSAAELKGSHMSSMQLQIDNFCVAELPKVSVFWLQHQWCHWSGNRIQLAVEHFSYCVHYLVYNTYIYDCCSVSQPAWLS